jgi:hypothetical protein
MQNAQLDLYYANLSKKPALIRAKTHKLVLATSKFERYKLRWKQAKKAELAVKARLEKARAAFIKEARPGGYCVGFVQFNAVLVLTDPNNLPDAPEDVLIAPSLEETLPPVD